MPVSSRVIKRGNTCEILLREDDYYAVRTYEGRTTLLNTMEEAEDLMKKLEDKSNDIRQSKS